MEKNTPFIELQKVSKYYSNSNNVSMGLHQISIKMNINEIIAITGQSGSGKSTFLNVVSKVDSYEEGEFYFNGKATSYFSKDDDELFRRNNVGFVFQNYNLVDSYTVKQNVMLPLLIQGKTVAEASSEALKIIEKVGLKDRVNHRGTKLSGGEKQRCVIARALASDSKILACDEPTGNLDSKTSKEIIDLLYEVSKDRLVLIVTHNFDEVADIATRNIEFSDGELIRDTKLKDVEESDLPVETDSKDNKLLKTIQLKLAFQNLIKTPKKTILSFLVLFVSCIFTAAMCILLVSYFDMFKSDFENSKIVDSSRNVISRYDQGVIDVDDLASKLGIDKSDLYLYSNIEEQSLWTKMVDVETQNELFLGAVHFGNHIPNNIDLSIGSKTLSKNEIYILTSKANYQFYKELVGKKISINCCGKDYKTYTLKGLGENKYCENNTFVYDYDGYLYENAVSDTSQSSLNIAYYYYNSDCLIKILDNRMISISDNKDGKLQDDTIYYYNKKFVLDDLSRDAILGELAISIGTVEKHKTNLKMKLIPMEESSGQILITKNAYEKILFENSKKVSVYNLSSKQIEKKLENTPYIFTNNVKENQPTNVLDIYLRELFMTIVVIIAIIIIYFLTYVILGRIYKSKNRDYTILRTLGISKKQMSHIVNFELLYISILSLIILYLIIALTPTETSYMIFNSLKILKLYQLIIFGVFFIIFSLKISQRFNRKLYTNTVNKTLKKEELKND